MRYVLTIIVIVLCVVLGFIGYGIYKGYLAKYKPAKEGFNPFELIAGLFELIPIVIKVFTNIDKMFIAFFNAAMGLIFSIVNIAIASSFIFTDSFRFGFALAKFTFKSIICTLENMKNMKYCIWFYGLDALLTLVQIIVMSILELLDTQFNIPKRSGVSLVRSVEGALEKMMEIDEMVHERTKFHIFGYPDSVISLCYTCKNPPSKKELIRNTQPLKDDIFVKVPRLIDEPIGYFISAGTNLAGVFSGF